MAKISQKIQKNTTPASSSNNTNTTTTTITTTASTTTSSTPATKVKRTRKSVRRDSPPQRSSIYRGVTRHRWTGRYEAHLWDKNCWNESQNKKGRQVYLGAYDEEEAAARAYDLAALKYWGQDTILNLPVSTYKEELKDMEGQSKEEYIGSLRRKSSGFSRGVSKYRGVASSSGVKLNRVKRDTLLVIMHKRIKLPQKFDECHNLCIHHHNGRWEARIGRVLGNKYLYLGTYATQEEAAAAYDMAAIEYRGLNAVTNFDLSRYIKSSLCPNSVDVVNNSKANPSSGELSSIPNPDSKEGLGFNMPNKSSPLSTTSESTVALSRSGSGSPASSALGLLLQSPKFKEMLERTSVADCSSSTTSEPNMPRRSFPDDIQTYFGCQDLNGYAEGDDIIFGELNSFGSSVFHCELDA